MNLVETANVNWKSAKRYTDLEKRFLSSYNMSRWVVYQLLKRPTVRKILF